MLTAIFVLLLLALALYVGACVEEKFFPTDKLCRKCGVTSSILGIPAVRTYTYTNYLTRGNICQECAFKEEQHSVH